jgi:hypothetical protein
MNLGDGVAVRVSALCLTPNGRLSGRLLASDAVRGALLLDLALVGRLTSTDESVVVDETPTGFEPTDRLLAAISAEPERSLDGWLAERRIGLRDVAESNVASGRWERRPGLLGLRPRYTDLHRDQTDRDLARSASRWPADATAADACVTAVAGATGLLDPGFGLAEPASPLVLASAGPVAWLCTAVIDHLEAAGRRYLSEAGALGAGPVGPF